MIKKPISKIGYAPSWDEKVIGDRAPVLPSDDLKSKYLTGLNLTQKQVSSGVPTVPYGAMNPIKTQPFLGVPGLPGEERPRPTPGVPTVPYKATSLAARRKARSLAKRRRPITPFRPTMAAG